MEKPPQFIREFSKENNQAGRDLKAQQIKKVRAEYFQAKAAIAEKKLKAEAELADRRLDFEKIQADIAILKNKLQDLSANGLDRILNYFEIKKIKAEILSSQGIEQDLEVQHKLAQESTALIINNEANLEQGGFFQETEEMLHDFYRQEEKNWANSDYNKEDIVKYFSPDYLSALSLEEYSLLLKRFPGEMVTHVTRQGIRDHVGHMYHTAGQGEYASGFMGMLQDRRLRSALSVRFLEKQKDQAAADMLGLSMFETKEEALKQLDLITGPGRDDAGGYADRNAIHFATEEVADSYYGSEKGNEIFVAYPSALIASQYYFGGQLKDSGGGYWNDQWVWSKEQEGMDLNAGLIFIPADAKVDRLTGSRYKLDENKQPLKNEAFHQIFQQMVDSEDFLDFARRAIAAVGRLHYSYDEFIQGNLKEKEATQLAPLCQELEEKFGLTDKRLQFAALDYQALQDLTVRLDNRSRGVEETFFSIEDDIGSALKRAGVFFQEAENPISSQEFWENYFRDNLKARPSKVIYYENSDPTAALVNWRQQVGIHKSASDGALGFTENLISNDSELANQGIDRFRSIAEKVIENYYSNGV